jgi:predicted TIM-barrel fold metal-dependent hydrolase
MSAPPCLPPREVTRPKAPPPPNACDTHAHVFGPADRFPYADDRSYTPPDAPLAKYLGMLDTIGFARGVLVQGSAHGHDNAAMLDALERQPQRLRGVAVADETVSPQTLRGWNRLGVRALRFNHFFRGGQLHYRGGVPLRVAETHASVMKELGWHLQLWIDVKDLPDTIPQLKKIGLPVVIDHMGRTDARAGTGTPGFQSLLRCVGEGWCWAKVSGAHRLSLKAPDYPDAPAVPRGAGQGQSGCAGVGRRLAASARRGRDARCRTSVRAVPAMDAGSRRSRTHPRHQSGEALRVLNTLKANR